MIFRIASLLTVATFFNLLFLSIKISHVSKYYSQYVSTKIWDVFHGNEVQEFDFIVVGGGSSGAVLANRLSRHNKVLLIEAGGTPFYANSFPVLAPQLLHIPETDYMYKTVPQENAAKGCDENRSYWPRGKMLGGSSQLNYMMYVRAQDYDYDNWANLTKDDGWSYQNLMPYFKRSIYYNGEFKDDIKTGQSYGTQSVEAQEALPIHKVFMEGGKELGYDVNLNFNSPQRRAGFGPAEVNQREGKRETSYSAFIEPILTRDNLVISTYSQAIKLEMNKSNKIVGVWYIQHGKKKYARATKEVIVSAGSVDSPKLLMLSGIGPKKHLEEVGIKPKIDLPVGLNLKDHIISFLFPFAINTTYSFRPDRDLGILDIFQYYWNGKGPISSTLGAFAQAFYTSSLEKKKGLDWTDFQMLILSQGPYDGIASDLSQGIKVKESILQKLFSESIRKSQDAFMLTLTLGRPKSVGWIKLASKDYTADPIIDPQYFSHPDDLSRFVEAVKFALKLVEETKAFKEIDAPYVKIPIDECAKEVFRSSEYWECYLKHISLTMYHPVSTCRMGSGLNDKTSVVDSKLRVLHTRALRIADASVMPELMNGNTNAGATVIGEKAADLIREFWASNYSVCKKMEILSRSWSHKSKCFYSRLV